MSSTDKIYINQNAQNAEKVGTSDAPASPLATLSEMFSNATPFDYWLMFLGTVGALGTGVSLPLFNILYGDMIDDLNGDPLSFSSSVAGLCIDFVIIGAANLLAGFLQVYCWTLTGERQTQRFRERYVNAVLSQDIAWFDMNGASELSTRLTDNVAKIQDGMGRKIGDLLQYITQVIALLILSLYYNWKLTCLMLCATPIIVAAGAFLINASTAAQQQSSEQYAKAGGLASETLAAIRTVTALNLQPSVLSTYRSFLLEALRVGSLKGFHLGLGNGALGGVVFFTYALGFWYGGELVANDLERKCTHDCVTGGAVTVVFFSTLRASMALGQLTPPLTSFFQARAAISTLLQTIKRVPLIDGLSAKGLRPEQSVRGEVHFNNVHFSYPSRPHIEVCRGFDLHVKEGETVALVGDSGCGKSTAINLLLRFYDPQVGAVEIDGLDIKMLNIKWLRSQFGYVGQEPVLFAGSILENIAYGLDPELRFDSLSDSERERVRTAVVAAAKLSNAHDFICRFPHGYDTVLDTGGVAVSTGQKQRIAIARALVKRPAVLLLDEATSALDTVCERVVQESIDALSASRSQTTIVVAHRLSTIRNADKICVISNGVIAEQGSHDDLLALNGLYSDLVRLQLTEAVAEDSASTEVDCVGHAALEGTTDGDGDSVGDASSPVDSTALPLEKFYKTDPAETYFEMHSTATAVEKMPLEQTNADNAHEKKEKQKKERDNTWRRVWSYILRFRALLAMGVVGAGISGAVFPCWGYLLAQTQNMYYFSSPNEIRSHARFYACLYIALGVATLASQIAQFTGVIALGEKVSCVLRSEMFEALLRQEISFFDEPSHAVGTLTTSLAEDAHIVNKAFGETFARQLQAVLTLAIGIALGFSASWQIAFVVLACLPLSILASAVQMQAISGQKFEQQPEANTAGSAAVSEDAEDGEKTDGHKKETPLTVSVPAAASAMASGHAAMISSAFTNMRTVSAFSLHHQIFQRYARDTAAISEERAKRSRVAGLGLGGSNTVLFCTYALLFWYASELIKDGKTTFVDVLTSILTLMLGALGLGLAVADMSDQRAGVEIAQRIFARIDAGRNSGIDGLEPMPYAVEEEVPRAEGRIELRNVRFEYPTRPGVQVCKGYSLTIEKGQTVAFVGPSGGGKSTIINLLMRFYEPDEGEVLLDGKDIREVNVRWLRSQIGYVGQEPVLFTGTVAENVLNGHTRHASLSVSTVEQAMNESAVQLGVFPCLAHCCRGGKSYTHLASVSEGIARENSVDLEQGESERDCVDLHDMVDACKAANAHDFVSQFPRGYDTHIGEGSVMVSGGQKQRIAIARSLIKRPAVLLLDEATSALDAVSERAVQESIDRLTAIHSQTTIVIAHRLSTIRNVDKIFVVDHGQIVESGTHDELVGLSGGLYKKLWNKQVVVNTESSDLL